MLYLAAVSLHAVLAKVSVELIYLGASVGLLWTEEQPGTVQSGREATGPPPPEQSDGLEQLQDHYQLL